MKKKWIKYGFVVATIVVVAIVIIRKISKKVCSCHDDEPIGI